MRLKILLCYAVLRLRNRPSMTGWAHLKLIRTQALAARTTTLLLLRNGLNTTTIYRPTLMMKNTSNWWWTIRGTSTMLHPFTRQYLKDGTIKTRKPALTLALPRRARLAISRARHPTTWTFVARWVHIITVAKRLLWNQWPTLPFVSLHMLKSPDRLLRVFLSVTTLTFIKSTLRIRALVWNTHSKWMDTQKKSSATCSLSD